MSMLNQANSTEQVSSDTKSVVLVGVGGQGILLASEIIAQTALKTGYDVKTNEVHGMAQRGGSVLAQIRFGSKVFSPLVPKGTATVLASLERIEILRYVDYLAPDGLAVVSDQKIIPVTVSSGTTPYPDMNEEDFRKIFPRLIYVEAVQKAAELGNARAANIILLGALSNQLNFEESDWEDSIKKCVKPKFVDLNLQAFHIGRKMGN
ncbi:MAG: indolepyruvate oxidoreductase subunit beta [Planctomycetia bacterium]|nr:indolepyruvate oxidoreductase subunit beta [Planctomycetia bacterium]